jgi:hypothetical protein
VPAGTPVLVPSGNPHPLGRDAQFGRRRLSGPFPGTSAAAECDADGDVDGDAGREPADEAPGTAPSEGVGSGVAEPGWLRPAVLERGCRDTLTTSTVPPSTTTASNPISHHRRPIRAGSRDLGPDGAGMTRWSSGEWFPGICGSFTPLP